MRERQNRIALSNGQAKRDSSEHPDYYIDDRFDIIDPEEDGDDDD